MKKIEIVITEDEQIGFTTVGVSHVEMLGALKFVKMRVEYDVCNGFKDIPLSITPTESKPKTIKKAPKAEIKEVVTPEPKEPIKPKPNAKLIYGKGVLLMSEKKYEEAIKKFDEALEINPDMKSAKEGKLNAERWVKKLAEIYSDAPIIDAQKVVEIIEAEDESVVNKENEDDLFIDLMPD